MAKVIRSGLTAAVDPVEGEPLAGAAEAGHHLVEDQHDAVLVAQLADAGEVARRRHQDAGGARDRLEQDRRRCRTAPRTRSTRRRCVQRALGLLLGRGRPELASGRGRARRSARGRGRTRWAPGASRRSRRPRRRCCRGSCGSVEMHLVAAGVQACHPDGVLDGVGAAVGEEDLVHAVGRPIGDPAARPRRGPGWRSAGAIVVEQRRLLLDRGDDGRVLVADVDVDQLAGEVEVAVARVVPHVAAETAGDDHRVERAPGPTRSGRRGRGRARRRAASRSGC